MWTSLQSPSIVESGVSAALVLFAFAHGAHALSWWQQASYCVMVPDIECFL